MPGAALAQVAGASLASHERDRRPHTLRRDPRRLSRGRGRRGAARRGGSQRHRGRQQRVHHGLVSGLRPAAHLHAGDAGGDGLRPLGRRQRGALTGRLAHLQEEGPVQGPGGSSHRGDERHAGRLQQRAERRRRRSLVRPAAVRPLLRRSLAARRREPGDDRLHAAVHVHAVVGVADGRVELRELVAPLRDDRRAGAQPCDDGGGIDELAGVAQVARGAGAPDLRGAHAPHRSPGVSTGASHSRVNSSSSRSRVTEQPAMSSEVI
ncbi:MAG: hypothetical protein BWY94_02313 [Actinobacteria bacterium ADurb.BinA094]|nr:MAG: hypothetical protein BWY94_02313 [Actinobacteria bacterium ADurb.BinA094]